MKLAEEVIYTFAFLILVSMLSVILNAKATEFWQKYYREKEDNDHDKQK